MLHVTDLRFSFGDTVVLDGVDIQLPERGLVALTGANGAGKTTLLRVLGRVYPCDNPSLHEVSHRVRMVYLDTGFLSLDCLTVRELFDLLARDLRRVDPTALVSSPLVCERMWQTRLAALSLGQRQRCVLAVAGALRDVHVVLLDEPFNGLDATALMDARCLLASMARTSTVVFATHDTDDVHDLADHVLRVEAPDVVELSTAGPDGAHLRVPA